MADIEKLGRYEIIRVLGKGAMGVVYEGRDPNLDRRVAIKTIRVQSLTPEAAAEYEGRFRTEARSAARLHHPNIVSVFDSGQDDDVAYLVMEFIQGQDLKHHLENGARFSVRSAIVMVHELLMALDHAHRQNVVHRDIKPANMLIETTGRIKLTDFGVARIQEPDETNLTQVGGAVGTPKYMSPEQAKGLRGDSRSDVFSAGVVLYELLTGALPFDGENQFIIIHQIVGHEPKRPSELNPEVPVTMDEVMGRAMAKNPDERYATAREFALALRGVAQQIGAATGTQPADVAGELGQYQANRTPMVVAALRDGSSTGIFGPSADVAMMTTVNHEAELGAWNEIKDSTNTRDFANYLQRFPSGVYARRAQTRMDQLALDDTSTRAKTEPQFRPPPLDEVDLDSTIGPFEHTLPMEEGTTPQSPSKPPVAPPKASKKQDPAASERSSNPKAPAAADKPKTTTPRRKTWPLLAVGGVLVGLLALGFLFRPGHRVEAELDVKPSLAPNEELIPSSPAAQPTTPVPGVAAAPASAAASAPGPAASSAVAAASTSASKPAAAASRPAHGASKPTTAASAASAASAAASNALRPVKPKASAPSAGNGPDGAHESTPVAPTPPPASSNGAGPSAAGQVCADKVFIFRIACIAEQCKSDRFRQTSECLRFKEMERKREEERNAHQR